MLTGWGNRLREFQHSVHSQLVFRTKMAALWLRPRGSAPLINRVHTSNLSLNRINKTCSARRLNFLCRLLFTFMCFWHVYVYCRYSYTYIYIYIYMCYFVWNCMTLSVELVGYVILQVCYDVTFWKLNVVFRICRWKQIDPMLRYQT